MRRGGEVARGLLAGLALGTVVVGLPVLLASVVGWPLPHQVPKVAEIADALGDQRVPETATVWKILAVVLWVAWAQVVVSVAVEFAAVVRGGLVHPLPGLGLAHGLVAPLVTAVALAWPAGSARPAAAAPAAVPAASAPPPSAPPGPAPSSPGPASPGTAGPTAVVRAATVEHVVVHRDTLWDLAEHYLGDGERVRELFEANKGRPQADGSALTDPGHLLRPGWVLSIPLDAPGPDTATGDVVVRPGDTLWDLAEDHLGDGHRYEEVFQRNEQRPQPDGGALVDPAVIEPGWVLRMPPASAVEATDPAPVDTSSGAMPPATPTVPAPMPTEAVSTTAVPAPAIPDLPPELEAAAPAEVAPAPEARAAAVDEGADAPAAPVGLLGGGVATAGLVVLLERLRRTQQRRRRAGRRLPQPAPEVALAERALRAGADTDTATQIDVALRAAAAAGGGGLAALRRVEAANGVTLALDTDAPAPAGFSQDGPGRWRTAADAGALDQLAAPALSPAPGLVPVGRDDAGTEILIDVEEAGVVSVVGDPATATSLLRSMAVCLMSAPWSEQSHVLVVGFDPHDEALSALAEVTTSDVAVHEAEKRMESVRAALAGIDCTSVAQARAGGVAADSCSAPLIIVAAMADRALTALVEQVAATPGHGVAIVMAVAEPAPAIGRVLAVGADGAVRLDGLEPLRARQLHDADTRMVAELVETASAADVAPSDEAVPPPRRIPSRPEPGRGALADLLDGVDVLVRVLGPIEVMRYGPEGEQRLEVGIQKSVEAIVYLALRETAADREELQAALWPAGTNSAKTFQNVVWAARKALGTDRDGAELLPDPVDGRYGVNPRLASTYGLFHELVARADEAGDARAAADLLAQALTLVQGEPFVGVGRNYAWVAPHAGIIVSEVVDAAEELAEVRLATGDWRGAEWAARQGLRAFPSDERLYRLLMRCSHAAGSVAGVQRVFAELVAAVADPDAGVEPLDTIHAETVALLDELSGARSRPDPSPVAAPGRQVVR
ncbi:MAG: BTAD domain-containing putative transcriptional regulator [Acidimicrobiales bacterium]